MEVDVAWKNGKLAHAEIRSKLGRECRLRTASGVRVTSEGMTVKVSLPEPGVVGFSTETGGTYDVAGV